MNAYLQTDEVEVDIKPQGKLQKHILMTIYRLVKHSPTKRIKLNLSEWCRDNCTCKPNRKSQSNAFSELKRKGLIEVDYPTKQRIGKNPGNTPAEVFLTFKGYRQGEHLTLAEILDSE